MHCQGEGIMSIERKYIDVPLSTITAPAFQSVALGTRPSQPVHELGLRLLELAKSGDAEGVRDLMNRGAPFSTDWLGTSPLHFAAQFNHLETVEILLKVGISRDARNKVERTPLHVAAQEGHAEVVKILITYGADVDCQDMLKMTPLHWASENGQTDCVRVLVDFGADPTLLNKFDKTPENIAHDNNFLMIADILHEAAEIDPITRKVLRNQGLHSVIGTPKDTDDDRSSDIAAVAAITGGASSSTVCDLTISDVPGIHGSPVTNGSRITTDDTPYKIHKIVGRRRINSGKSASQTAKQIDVNTIDFSNVNDTDQEDVSVNSFTTQEKSGESDTESTNNTLKMLQEHGITMLPVDDTSIVTSAVQSGQTVVLTEAGKMALNYTKTNQNPPVGGDLKKLSVTSKLIKTNNQKILINGRKLIRVQPQDLINMTKDRKVIIHTGDKRLGRPGQIVIKRTLSDMTKPLDVQNKTVTSSDVSNKLTSNVTGPEIRPENGPKDWEEMTRLLKEARQEALMYKERLLLIEKEFQEYKLKHESANSSSSSSRT